MIHWNTFIKILYLKRHKWLLSQNKEVTINYLGYLQYEGLAKYIKPSFKKHQSERMLVPGL